MKLAAVLAALTLAASPAFADQILTLGQTSGSNTITATDNGTTTTISGTDVAVNVTQDLGGLLGGAFLDLTATSIDAAQQIGSAVLQHYSGTFSVFTGAGQTGTNILSGSFSDGALGSGPSLVLEVGAPPDSLTLTSDLLTAAQLALPAGIGFTFSNVSPNVHIDVATIGAFTASVAENASATAVPAPGPLAVLGVGLFGLGMVRYRRSYPHMRG